MEFGVNFNGDRALEGIKKRAGRAERLGFHYLWIGENPEFMHPFPVMAAIAEATRSITIGSGIISPYLNRCAHIMGGFKVLREAYGDRFVVGIAPGDRLSLKRVGVEVEGNRITECSRSLRSLGLRVLIGASEPRLLAMGSTLGDGVLLNYVNPEYVEWALGFVDSPYAATYSPSLLLQGNGDRASLRLAAAVVAAGSSLVFQREFHLMGMVAEIRDILRRRAYGELRRHEAFLLEGFTLSGTIGEIEDRIGALGKLGIRQVVFGHPMSNRQGNLERLAKAVGMC